MNEDNFKLLESFINVNVGVIGDVMLDVYLKGVVDRISPEAPVPIIHVIDEEFVLGGAANVALNIKALGATPLLLGVIGVDEAGEHLVEMAEKDGIETSYLIRVTSRKTTEKKRIVAKNQQILRIDSEEKNYVGDDIEAELKQAIEGFVSKVDIVCVADYAKGVMTPEVIRYLVEVTKKNNKKVIVDPKPRNIFLYKNLDLLTPNQMEVLQASGQEDPDKGIKMLKESTKTPVLMTRGADGMSLLCDSEIQRLKSVEVDVVDVSGAGDTVTAVMTLLRALDVSYFKAATIASVAASIAITKHKTSPVYLEELRAALHNHDI